ncbi:uncharacterized protein Bfra_003490 [Botrytis fragariae]|uniref:Uncharacterized protein n=1 Tax=Botrytis fragariae TaxID=1964551 RepID=A0A8H6AWU2_9HELO|nr:uncharacterized protein Bfra_003490 [Botrytis fragariae]KAF5875037.1 hypothetical protein Bfra_003490 [Botrytis fragariae]
MILFRKAAYSQAKSVSTEYKTAIEARKDARTDCGSNVESQDVAESKLNNRRKWRAVTQKVAQQANNREHAKKCKPKQRHEECANIKKKEKRETQADLVLAARNANRTKAERASKKTAKDSEE